MTAAGTEERFPVHRFAWDGFSFLVPLDWNLSYYDFGPGTSSIRMEDDALVRLQMEWCRPGRPAVFARVQERYRRQSAQVEALAQAREELGDLPPGWAAFLYRMQDGRRLLTCFWLSADGRFFCFFRYHLEHRGPGYARQLLRLLVQSFRRHEEGPRPWEVYDLAAVIPRPFRLIRTAFEAGRKRMEFDWRLRRLYLWYFTLADRALKGKDPAEWSAEFLNQFKGIRGPRFGVGPAGTVAPVRRTRHPLGHYHEISRWCFRYRVWCIPVPDRNALGLAVFHYRRRSDLALLDPPGFLFPAAPGELPEETAVKAPAGGSPPPCGPC